MKERVGIEMCQTSSTKVDMYTFEQSVSIRKRPLLGSNNFFDAEKRHWSTVQGCPRIRFVETHHLHQECSLSDLQQQLPRRPPSLEILMCLSHILQIIYLVNPDFQITVLH